MLRLMIQALKVAAILVLTLAVVFTTQRALSHYLNQANEDTGEMVTFSIAEEESVDSVASRLQEADLIRSGSYFKLRMRLTNADAKLKAGRFSLRKGMTVNQIIEELTTSEAVGVVNIRFQEGWRSEEYAARLVELGLIGAPEEFLEALQQDTWNYDFLSSRPGGVGLEGYIFPDTYEFRADATPEDIVATLLDTFEMRVPAEERSKAAGLGFNFHQVMTIASIIEREAVVPEERPIIASVYYNRLRENMPLQADPTVQYAIGEQGNWWPPVTPDDLNVESAYNTYRTPSLPPAPICNPSLASIEAALNPAETEYFYFVVKGDGSGAHVFANTYYEHLKNIEDSNNQEST